MSYAEISFLHPALLNHWDLKFADSEPIFESLCVSVPVFGCPIRGIGKGVSLSRLERSLSSKVSLKCKTKDGEHMKMVNMSNHLHQAATGISLRKDVAQETH